MDIEQVSVPEMFTKISLWCGSKSSVGFLAAPRDIVGILVSSVGCRELVVLGGQKVGAISAGQKLNVVAEAVSM